MRSLNPHWTMSGFHARIADLAEIAENDRVLDLGCGRGGTVPHLIAKTGSGGRVVAADRNAGDLADLSDSYPEEIVSGRLARICLDLTRNLPFGSASFDSIICQNVVECVAAKDGLLAEMHRVLRPGGSALIGHHDFDGVLIASDDRDLTRRLVHGYADHVQRWQDASDGQMGRLLPGLVARSPFGDARTETLLFVDLVLSPESYARGYLDAIFALRREFGAPDEAAERWLNGLEERSRAGAFFYAAPWTYVLARRL